MEQGFLFNRANHEATERSALRTVSQIRLELAIGANRHQRTGVVSGRRDLPQLAVLAEGSGCGGGIAKP